MVMQVFDDYQSVEECTASGLGDEQRAEWRFPHGRWSFDGDGVYCKEGFSFV